MLICLALSATAWYVAFERARFELGEAAAHEFRHNANIAIALEEHAVRTIRGVEQAVRFIRRDYAARGLKMDIARDMDMGRGASDDALHTVASITDDRGNVILSSAPTGGASHADRDFFKFHLQNRKDELYINKPVRDRASGRWQIPMSMRLSNHDGTFAGVVVLSVDPDYFAAFYGKARIGGEGLLTLVGLDGLTRVRQVGSTSSYGEDLRGRALFTAQGRNPVGDFEEPGSVDGVPRFISYRTLEQYPLIVGVGTSKNEALAPVRERARGYYIGAGMGSAALLVFAAGLVVALSRQRRAVDALALTEAQFRATFNQAAIGIAHASPEGRFLRVNPKLCAILGYSESELLQLTLVAITHPADVAETEAHLKLGRESREGPITQEREKRYLRKDGSVVWVAIAATLLRDDRGRPQYSVTAIQDVTERKRAEALTGLEHSVARCFTGTDSAADTLKAVMRAICESERWELGRYWRVDEAAGLLRPTHAWSVPDPRIDRFLEATGGVGLESGKDWIGRAWASGEPQWVADITKDDRLMRQRVVYETGLRALFTFPVVSEGTTIGVFVFTSREIREPDAQLLATARAIGSQAGQFLRRKEAEAVLLTFRAAMDATSDAIYLTDRTTMRFLDVNEAACRMQGSTREELLARGPAGTLKQSVEELTRIYDSIIAGGPGTEPLELQRVRKDGSQVWVELRRQAQRLGEGWMIITVVRDITERKKLEARLLQQATYDGLTQLPNRALSHDRLRQAIVQAKRKSMHASLLFIDLDRFKAVNDTHGHSAGDELLQQVSQRLAGCVRAGDTVGRLGGDEFVIVLPEIAEAKAAGLIARKVVAALARPFQLSGYKVSISASVGIASYPQHGDTAEAIIKNADSAMFSAKQSGRDAFRFFAAEALT